MSFNYVVTVQNPTAATHSLKANFTSPTDLNLIVSKSTRIEIHLVNSEGLQPILDVPLNGRVLIMQSYRPVGESKDLLFLVFDRYFFCVLEYITKTGELRTRSNGELQDKIGRPVESGHIGAINSGSSIVALHLYEGLMKVIPIANTVQTCVFKDAFNLRVEELHLIDMCFVNYCPTASSSSSSSSSIDLWSACSTIAILYEDTKNQRSHIWKTPPQRGPPHGVKLK
eukprot:NODE_1914_length_812_cov_8.851900_g1514_i0.p1 GENE.NODE_1914_length_812_cov_8.851900_g1514_i0~~NODE_1914_length_812_cov_8.851900_g1514_i0.p1  ORF type:complete len:227 (-),score=27.34 NODE_1914_length_812_cov_8.851900_g1514_i0:93-773(-)